MEKLQSVASYFELLQTCSTRKVAACPVSCPAPGGVVLPASDERLFQPRASGQEAKCSPGCSLSGAFPAAAPRIFRRGKVPEQKHTLTDSLSISPWDCVSDQEAGEQDPGGS